MDRCPVQRGLGMNEQYFQLSYAAETGISFDEEIFVSISVLEIPR